MQDLHWLEWIGLTLVAYGVAAGATRGLTQQFTRFLTWAAAVVLTGSLTPTLGWVATQFVDQPDSQRMLVSWFSLATLLAAVVSLGWIRRILFGSVGAGKSFADRIMGGLMGSGVAILVWLTLYGGVLHAYRLPHIESHRCHSWAQILTSPYRHLPLSLQSVLFQFDQSKLDSSDLEPRRGSIDH